MKIFFSGRIFKLKCLTTSASGASPDGTAISKICQWSYNRTIFIRIPPTFTYLTVENPKPAKDLCENTSHVYLNTSDSHNSMLCFSDAMLRLHL